jgi:hypothetical protein
MQLPLEEQKWPIPSMSEEEQRFLSDAEPTEEGGYHLIKNQHQSTDILTLLPVYSNVHQ